MKKSLFKSDVLPCVLCHDARCDKACAAGIDISKIIRSVWFDNEIGARNRLPDSNYCNLCKTKNCMLSCPRHVDIPKIMNTLYLNVKKDNIEKSDYDRLRSDICSLTIENPFLLSSSVVGSNYEMCARAFDMGWAGVCYKTISYMDIHESSPRFEVLKGDSGTIEGFKNIEQLSEYSVEENLKIFNKLKVNYPNKFLLVSIMGRNDKEWQTLARAAQDAGADALELNFSCPNMVEENAGSDIGEVPSAVERFTQVVKKSCSIPVIVKLTPNVTRMSDAAEAAVRASCDGIAGINTIKSLVNVDVDGCDVTIGGYSGNAVRPIAMRFISEISHNEKCKGKHISAMGGVENWKDAMQFISLGASSIQVTTAVMQYGYRIIEDLKEGLAIYLKQKNTTISEFCGSAINKVVDVETIPRDIKILPRFNKEKCISCLRCFISCRDGGHQAISYGNDKKPMLNAKKCVGCHLCIHVCPEHCISSSEIVLKNN